MGVLRQPLRLDIKVISTHLPRIRLAFCSSFCLGGKCFWAASLMVVLCLLGSEEARAEVREGEVRGSASDRAMVSGWFCVPKRYVNYECFV